MDPADFATLVRSARAGDGAAFESLVRPHLRFLFNLALGRMGQSEGAEDAVQEALLRVFRRFPPVAASTELRAFLARVVINECRRQRASRWLRLVRTGGEESPREAAEPGQDRLTDQRRVYATIVELLPELAARERSVFVLRALEELDFAEIGTILGIRDGTARQLHLRARRKMVAWLTERGMDILLPD